jgi:hypothetical protein
MNFYERIQLHRKKVRSSSSKFHKFVSKNSWNNFVFGTVYETTNYLIEFKYRYPTYNLSIGEMMILSHFTQLEARILEQSPGLAPRTPRSGLPSPGGFNY